MNAGFLHFRPAALGGRVVDHGHRSLGAWQGVQPQLQETGSQRDPRHRLAFPRPASRFIVHQEVSKGPFVACWEGPWHPRHRT